MGDRADETNFSNIKYTLYEKFVRWLKYLIDCRNAKQSCLDLIKRTNPKRILVMNCSSFRPDMFKQRSHHFAQFFSKHFDLVIYKSLAQITVKKWENNIWLSKWLPDIKFKDADLIGFPFRVTVGKTINEGFVEYKVRETGEQEKYTPDEATEKPNISCIYRPTTVFTGVKFVS